MAWARPGRNAKTCALIVETSDVTHATFGMTVATFVGMNADGELMFRDLRDDKKEGASKQELRADRRDIAGDTRDIRKDERDVRKDRRDRRRDVRDYRRDRREAR